MRPVPLRAALLGALAVLAGLTIAATPASAAPVALDAPENGTGAAPLIAYDPSTHTTYVAWADPIHPGVDLCVLPAGEAGCEGGRPVLLEDSKYPGYSEINHPGLGGLVVLSGGEAVVIGTPVSTGTVAWASPPGGAAFLSAGHGLQNGGNFISPVSLFYALGNAVALSNTDVGLLDDYSNYFSDSPLTAESPAIPEPGNTNPGGKFPRKSLETAGPEIAAEPAPAPAPAGTDVVVGVGDNFAGPPEALPGCLNKEGTGFGVSVGKVNGTSKAAGTLNAKGLPAYGVLACSAEAPVLASGGQDGIGLVEEEGDGFDGAGSLYTVDFRPFIATAIGGAFGAPVQLADVSNESLGGVNALDLSEDAGTGVYATWEDQRGLVLAYSANGGASWEPPAVVPEPTGGTQGNPTIVGIGGGNAEIAYVDNPGTGPQVFLEAVSYQQLALAPTTLTTNQSSGAISGASITIPAGTIGETDQAALSGTNATAAVGTVTYQLYPSSSCTGTPVFTSTGAVTAGKPAASAPVSAALAPGTYYWLAAYGGDSRNKASTSACGSEVLTISSTPPPPSSEFKVEAIVTESGGTITITIVVTQPGEATLTVTISTSTLAHSAAVDAKSKKCKHGQIKLKHKCVPATTVVGKTSAKATAGGPLKLTVHLSNKIKSLLKKGKTVHLTGTLTFQSALGGKPVTHTYSLTVKGHKHKKRK